MSKLPDLFIFLHGHVDLVHDQAGPLAGRLYQIKMYEAMKGIGEDKDHETKRKRRKTLFCFIWGLIFGKKMSKKKKGNVL